MSHESTFEYKERNEMKEETETKFLLEEFAQCFDQMRHYDNMKVTLLTFAFTLYSVTGAIAFALCQFFLDKDICTT